MAQVVSYDSTHTAAPYTNIDPSIGTIVPSKFWGAPVIQANDGTLWCPGYTGATYSNRQWDTVLIPGVVINGKSKAQTPGICRVTCKKARDVDKKKIKGADGARITLSGLEPAMVEFEIHIWTPQQLLELDILRPKVFPGPQKVTTTTVTTATVPASGFTDARGATIVAAPAHTVTSKKSSSKSETVTKVFSVSHPTLDTNGVTAVIFYSFEGPEQSSRVPGAMMFTFKAIEHSLPKKGVNTTVSPTGAVALGSTLETSNPLPGATNGGP